MTLEGRNPVSQTTIHGRNAVGCGAIFLAFGLLVLSAGFAAEERGSRLLPRALGALLFVMVGAAYLLHGLKKLAEEKRRRPLSERHPAAAWLWDHPWNRYGVADDSSRAIGRIAWLIVAALFVLVPVNWMAFSERGKDLRFFWLLLDLVFIGVPLGAMADALARRSAFGRCRLRFRTFPYVLGQPLVVDFVGGRSLRHCTSLAATLRFVNEEYVHDRDSTSIARTELYSDSLQFSIGDLSGAEGRVLRIEFPLPKGAFETRLRDRPPCYWELEVEAEAPGRDYRGRFLLPVYAAPGSAVTPVAVTSPPMFSVTRTASGRAHPWMILMGTLGLLVLLAMSAVLGLMLWRHHEAESYVPAPARIDASDVKHDDDMGYHPVVTFRYQVGDRIYTSNTIRVPESTGRRAWAQRVADRYRPGAVHTAYYDPRRPQRAVLERGADVGLYAMAGFVFLLTAALAWGLTRLVRKALAEPLYPSG